MVSTTTTFEVPTLKYHGSKKLGKPKDRAPFSPQHFTARKLASTGPHETFKDKLVNGQFSTLNLGFATIIVVKGREF